MGHVVFELLAEMLDEALHRPGGGVAGDVLTRPERNLDCLPGEAEDGDPLG